ncbi:unnamed protein product [Phaeothamnion confervicola]
MGLRDKSQGLKSIIINLWSILTIIMPIFIIVRYDIAWDLLQLWVGATGLMLLIPPVGWLRPHPYSDFSFNVR